MQTVAASAVWTGPNIDAFTLFVEPTPAIWAAEPVGDTRAYLYQALDKNRERTGQLAGVHVAGFLDFGRWDELPKLDMLWQLPGREPLPLEALLRVEQQRAREEAAQDAHVRTAIGCV